MADEQLNLDEIEARANTAIAALAINAAMLSCIPALVREVRRLRAALRPLLDAVEYCHICHGQLALDEQGPAHCENCSWDCDVHEEPNCTPYYALHDAARKALEATDAR